MSAKWGPELLLTLAGFVIVAPLWVVLRPPIQDLPQHAAAVRVLGSYTDPSYRFQEYYQLTLGRTQYLTVYLLGACLAKLIGPTYATKVVLSAALLLTPVALARLLRSLAFDPWLACLALPFVFNVHVAFGFLNFLAAIPLLLVGLALAVEQRRCATSRGQAWLAAVMLLCFFTHVVPFGLLIIAVVILTRWQRHALPRHAFVILPSVTVFLFWLAASPAGKVVSSLGRSEGTTPWTHVPFGAALRALPDWIIHITTSEDENLRLIIWMIVALALLGLGVAFPATSGRRATAERSVEPPTLGRAVVLLLVPLSMVAYFTLPHGYSFIWPISQRFPVLAILLGIPVFGHAPKVAVRLAAVVSLCLAVMAASEQAEVFRASSANAYLGFDEVVAQIPKGSRVVTLVFERQLEGLQLSPMLHAAGWVQAERGGIVTFSFAEFPSSPFAYRANPRPPPIPLRWEWAPDSVVPDRDLGWYDYCLVQGRSKNIEVSRRFNEVTRRGRWSLWRRTGPADPSPSAN
jgi:hypothetical protein